MDEGWYHDPTLLRQQADVFDFKGRTTLVPMLSSAWYGKAEALRSRADIIEKLSSYRVPQC